MSGYIFFFFGAVCLFLSLLFPLTEVLTQPFKVTPVPIKIPYLIVPRLQREIILRTQSHRNYTSGLRTSFSVALKALLAFFLCSHSCSSLEQPPDHTRRLTFVQSRSRGQTEEFASYQIFTVCTRILVFARWQGAKTSRHRGSRLMNVWRSFGSREAE